MASAICFKCGSVKSGALVGCRDCSAQPRTNSEHAVSLALSEHLSSQAQLGQYSREIREGKKLTVPREALLQAIEALKDPQLLSMLGGSAAAPAQPTASQPGATRHYAPAQRSAPHTPPPATVPPKAVTPVKATVLHQSPFAVLGVTTRDNRKRIVELAEEKSLELDHDVCQKARSDLTNPRTRLSVEIAWLPGVSPRKATQLIELLASEPLAIREETGLPTLAHLNLLAAAFEFVYESIDAEDLAQFIQETAYLADELSAEEVVRDINEDRAVSGFAEVKAIELVEEELAERKRYYRNAIKEALNRLPSATLVEVMTSAVDGATIGGDDHAPSLIDDLVDSYEVETQGVLESGAQNVQKLIKAARDAAPSGEEAVRPYVDKILAAVTSWDRVAQPIQLSAKARGVEHEASSALGWAIRSLAIDLFNTHDMLAQSQHLTGVLQELFAELPEISERVEQDVDALDEIEADRNERAERLRAIFEKFRDFNLTETTFAWKNRTYAIESIAHIAFFRSITTHKTNFVETGKTEKAVVTLSMDNGQTVQMSIDEQGMFWNKDLSSQIQALADFYGFLMHVTFDRRLQFYEDQIETRGFWVYDECQFFPGEKIVFRGREFHLRDSTFLRSYGSIEMRKKDFGVLDKLKREVSLTKIPQFSTLTDTDVIFHMLKEHMGLTWGNN